ncbi:hypothetical protein E2C01_055311 [Portunus trituberculatus]|uniref:Uncharacterized protein n=1 Tax=Portunus trituberculatus TaxID=210409 RepID=A0A5B7GXB5_PORTR|nr:hypothetical protein [Portunus trituberculatus]
MADITRAFPPKLAVMAVLRRPQRRIPARTRGDPTTSGMPTSRVHQPRPSLHFNLSRPLIAPNVLWQDNQEPIEEKSNGLTRRSPSDKLSRVHPENCPATEFVSRAALKNMNFYFILTERKLLFGDDDDNDESGCGVRPGEGGGPQRPPYCLNPPLPSPPRQHRHFVTASFATSEGASWML